MKVNGMQLGGLWLPFDFTSALIFVLVLSSSVAGLGPTTPRNTVGGDLRSRALSSNGYTDDVQWDEYSLVVKGQRVFLHSGEFHTYRLPVPSLWLDILQKIKAAGLNGISVYTHWGQINPSPGVIDFDGYRDLQPLFDAAKTVGIWIVLRPRPYINAETTAGGIAHWATSQVAGTLRTNDSDYEAAWRPYIEGIINTARPNQITEGGPVIAIQIDNEFSQTSPGAPEYFTQLETAYREGGIKVPFTYNDPGMGRSFVNGTGAVNVYGFDEYPQRYNCAQPEIWQPVPTNYHDYHESTDPSEPFFIPEFQGGSLIPWGPNSPQYSGCRALTGAEYEDVFYKVLWASNVKMVNYYMLYGGTSWGAIPYYGVYTSYDYGGAIMENRFLTPKYNELKKQGLFLRSSPELYMTDWRGNSSTSVVNVSTPNIFVVLLSNLDTGTSFYFTRHTNSSSIATTEFSLNISTKSQGPISVPQLVNSIALAGRESKVIVIDYAFGRSSLIYSTASVFFAGRIGNRDVLFVFGNSDQCNELALHGASSHRPFINSTTVSIQFSQKANSTIIGITPGVKGLVPIIDSDDQLILYADADTADTFFSPVISSSSGGDFANYWQVGTNSSVLVGGPYLVRNASIAGDELRLRGDLNARTTLRVYGPSGINKVTWNGDALQLTSSAVERAKGLYTAQLRTTVALEELNVPKLANWRFQDSLPEIQSNFSDESWTVANHTKTNIPFPPYYGDGRILYGCDYEFCENVVLWRGHFNGTDDIKSANLSINGGAAFAASVWLNDLFLNTSFGNSSNNADLREETDEKFVFSEGSVKIGQDNVITIVQDNMGLNETGYGPLNSPKSPRGIRGFQLNSGNFSEWRVQGKLGGYTNYPDKTRGVLNEGGLFGERLGWHLPGFNTNDWALRNFSDGLPGGGAGVGFFVTTFELNVSEDLDAAMSFVFDGGSDATVQPYRALLFVNGWMMGKRVGNLGPQTKFPVHQGILNYNGENTIAVALWSMLPNASIIPTLGLELDNVVEGGVGGVISNNPSFGSRPGSA